jgi:RimJ/RimL family protein N-acetyltransferase
MLQDEPLEWESHKNFWFTYTSRIDWIILLDDRSVRSVFFKILNSRDLDIGIYIADVSLRGLGIGGKSINFAIRWAKTNGYFRIFALIHNDNEASIRMFTKIGFEYIDSLDSLYSNYQLVIEND